MRKLKFTLLWFFQLLAVYSFGQEALLVKAAEILAHSGPLRTAAEELAIHSEQIFTGAKLIRGLKYEQNLAYLSIDSRGFIQGQVRYVDENNKIISTVINTYNLEDIANRNVIIEPEVYFSRAFNALKEKPQSVHIICDYNTKRFAKINTKTNRLELSPSFHVDIAGEKDLRNAINLSTWPLLKEDISIAAVLNRTNDIDEYAILDRISKEHAIKVSSLNRKSCEKIFKENENRTLVLLGHYDGTNISSRDIKGSSILEETFTMSELDALSKKYNVYSIFLGCNTAASNVSGYLETVYNMEVLHKLENALKADILLDFYSEIGFKDNPLVITEIKQHGERVLLKAEVPNLKTPAIVVIMNFGREVPVPQPHGFVLFLRKTVNIYYLLGITLLYFASSFFVKGEKLKLLANVPVGYTLYWVLGKIVIFILN